MRARIFIVLVFVFAARAALAQELTPQQEAEVHAIGNHANCLCGCLTTINECPHPHCAMKAQERAVIIADVKAGDNEPKVIQDLVLKYGVKILPSPPAKGFNLTAWILPGVGLLGGLVVAVDITRRWRKARVAGPAEQPAPDPNLLAAIEEEMKDVLS